MKKLSYITTLFLSGSLLFMTSCDDILDTKAESAMDEVQIYSKYELAYGTITSIYHSFGETNSYRGRVLPWYGFNTDIEWYNNSDKVGDGKADIAVYACETNNNQLNIANDPWSKMYEAVERCNLAIAGLRNYGNTENDKKMAHLLGEALTLRAVLYADIVNCWGDVPARFEPVSAETMYIPVSNKDIIFKQLIQDLQEAQDLVYWPNEADITATVEHVNKAFVKGLLARICMQAAGYSVRENGTTALSSDAELAKSVLYPIALQACKDVIESGTCRLEDAYETIFINNCKDVVDAGRESLWEIPFANEPSARGRQVYTFGVKHQRTDQFGLGQGGQVGPTPHFFYDYSIKDKRRDVTCVPYRWSNTATAEQELWALSTWSFGKYRYEWMNRYISEGTDDGINKQYMRYADILLMRAELENELNGPAAAAPYLTQVRQRAFDASDWNTEVTQYVSSVSGSKDAMFQAIVDERAFEFCGEMIRKADLIRWNMLKSKLDEAKSKMYSLRDRSGKYADINDKLYFNRVDFTWTRNGNTYVESGAALAIYGLNRGETADKTNEYEENTTWISTTKLEDNQIEAIYVRNPDLYMYWPIFDVITNASNGSIKNPSWYQ